MPSKLKKKHFNKKAMLVPGDVDHIKRNWDSPKIEKLSYPLLPPDFHSPGSHLAPAQPMKNMAVWWYTCKNETWVFFLRRMKKICRWKRSMGFGRGYGVEYRGSRVKCRRSRVKCRGSSKWHSIFSWKTFSANFTDVIVWSCLSQRKLIA